MNSEDALLGARRTNALQTILWAGLTCGVMDITAALVVYGFFGVTPVRLLQGIASGLLGPRAFTSGLATALLGLCCHFFIAMSAATVYFAASRRIDFLVQNAISAGILYAVAVYFFMNRIIVPLSAARQGPFSVKMMIIGLVIHIFCVGLPISTIVRRYSA